MSDDIFKGDCLSDMGQNDYLLESIGILSWILHHFQDSLPLADKA